MGVEVQVKASGFEVLSGERSSISDQQLLAGANWIRKTDRYNLKTPYGEIFSERGDFFVNYEKNKVFIVNHLGKLKINLKDGSRIELPPGFEIWISEIQANRKNLVGFLQPVDMRDHAPALGKLWNSDSNSLKEEMLKFQSRWGDRTSQAANYYKSLAQRKIASVENASAQVAAAKKRENLAREANRKLLFERAFGR